jgi:hypothetical protein
VPTYESIKMYFIYRYIYNWIKKKCTHMKKSVRKFKYFWMSHYFYSLISSTVKQYSFGYIYSIYNLACVHADTHMYVKARLK